MLTRLHRTARGKDEGFTLIELLVVMIIIGILAAIAVPVFITQRQKARDTATKADVSMIGKEIATYYVDGTGVLTATFAAGPPATITLADGAGYNSGALTLSNGTARQVADADFFVAGATTWCIGLTNADGQVDNWKYSASGGLAQGDC